MTFDFVGKRKIWFLISLLFIFVGVISLFIQNLNYGIDFSGGTKITFSFSENVSSEDIREVLADYNLETSLIQESENNQFIIRTSVLSESKGAEVIASLQKELGDLEVLSNELVGSVVSSELKNKSIIALIIAAVLMIIYITIRFELSFALSAIIALIHDVLITLSIFSLLQIEINISFVAAVLTIIGYSINDTIVIFDRIRENLSFKQKETLPQLVNRSISQSLTRSINTSLTTIAVLIALFLFGGETTKVFSFAMIIGFTAGTYSSIFLASPLWLELKNLGLGKDKRRRRKPVPASK